jgi:hypothetical protein
MLHNFLSDQTVQETGQLDTDGPDITVTPGSWRANKVQLDSAAAMNPSGERVKYAKTGQQIRLYL